MNRDEFTTALAPLKLDCLQDIVEKYEVFVTYNVDHGQFVDFTPMEDRDVAIGLWRDTIFGGLYGVKEAYGIAEAVRIMELSMEIDLCFYPSEMLPAAEYIRNGVDVSKFPDLIDEGMLEDDANLFPKAPPGADLGCGSVKERNKDSRGKTDTHPSSVMKALRQQKEPKRSTSEPPSNKKHQPDR